MIVATIDYTQTTRKTLAVGHESWAAMAESDLVYDPRLMWNTWLVTRFFDGLTALPTVHDIEGGLALVRQAAQHALALKVPLEHGAPSLMFSVVLDRGAEAWVYSLGVNFVLRLGREKAEFVVWPNSLLGERMANGEKVTARDHAEAIIPTTEAANGAAWQSEVRVARVELEPAEWIIAVQPSVAVTDGLRLEQLPRNKEELQSVVEALAKPYAQYTRTWVALGR